MGNQIITNDSDTKISVDTFTPGKMAMHHTPDSTIEVEAKQSVEIPVPYIRFKYDSFHFILCLKQGATLVIGGQAQDLWDRLNFDDTPVCMTFCDMFECHHAQQRIIAGLGDEASRDPEENPSTQMAVDAAKEAAAIGGASAIGGIAAPVAVVGAVQALGFTSTGIAAGSTAAAMMASTAIASGGGVTSGSFVAICQSIGALGVLGGPLGLAVGAVGAVAMGGVVYGGVKLHEHLKYQPDEEDEKCWDACLKKHKRKMSVIEPFIESLEIHQKVQEIKNRIVVTLDKVDEW